jgi:hypothetical protein
VSGIVADLSPRLFRYSCDGDFVRYETRKIKRVLGTLSVCLGKGHSMSDSFSIHALHQVLESEPQQSVNGQTIHEPPVNPVPKKTLEQKLNEKKEREPAGASETVLTVIPVRTPDKRWYFRAHPDPTMSVPIDILAIDDAEGEEIYFLDPELEYPVALDRFVIPAILTRCITSDGSEFFYLAKQSPKSPKASTRKAIETAKRTWIQQAWKPVTKQYEIFPATQLRREPKWSNSTFNDLLLAALSERLIDSADHEVIIRLIDPKDDE